MTTGRSTQELRKDPIVGRWVIIAPDRLSRPNTFSDREEISTESFDPFLAGNEDATTPEILAYRDGGVPNGPGWRVRVIPNKFPAVRVEGQLEKRGEGIYDKMNAIGAHEVIIECPHRETNMSRLSVDNIREVLWVYRDRLVDLKRDRRLVHGLIFKNKGARAGASLDHAHSQLIVTPIVPIAIQEELEGAREFYDYRGRCIFEDMIQQELASEVRVVLETEHFVVICPYASRFPFETWILPRQHSSHFENIPKPMVEDLGVVMKTVLRKLELGLDDPPYNYVLHSAPFSTHDLPHYLWHIEIFPRLSRVAGFEWGSGFYINPVAPEEAARFLRETDVEEST
ncbi:galactose-1-phosphate uridylyltransferase [Planctomicrobium sp. SH664]|uniref:galactose-1-phosphate uridylyltransferase n=1 Tax=Planctomicrobium sp. SH664 TaxID=3448125 RepID=UPI003F5B5CDB